MSAPNQSAKPNPCRTAPSSPQPKKRFRIEKLEERIAPKKGGGGQLSSGAVTLGGPSIY